MRSQVNEIDAVTVEVEVQVPWDRVKQGLDASYGKLQKQVRVRGFRPGKTPRSVLTKLYGPQVNHEVISTLVEEGLLEAVQEHSLAIVATPEVRSLPSIERDKPLSFTAKLEIRPKVDGVVVDGLEVSRPSSAVADAEVDAELERLRIQHAEIVTPDEPRPAALGDLLTVDYTVEVDGEEKAEMAAQGRTVELGSGRLVPAFEEGLLGAKVDDEVTIRVAYDDDAPNEDLKNRRALFRVKITELRSRLLPDLDDEFAQDLGEHETLDALRAATRAKLEEAAKGRADSAVREQLVEQLVDKNPVPVPPSLVDQQEQGMRRELAFLAQIAGPGFDLGASGELRDRAEKKVRAALLMGEIARREGLTIEPEEIDAQLAKIAEASGKHIAKVRVEYAGEKRDSLANKLLEDKLLDFLLGRATVTDAPPRSETDAGESDE
ncbi:MAG: trigger factor [Sandaracinaceae bacterium]|nr:trigger factor [Sandaracinaceae bacterium]